MADKDIEIALKTTGDDSGAKTIENAINKVEDASDAASESVKKITLSTTGSDDLTKMIDEQAESQRRASDQADKHAKSLKEVAAASKVLVAVQTVDFLKQATAQIAEASKQGGILHGELGNLDKALPAINTGLDSLSAGFGAAVATGNPVVGVLAGIAAGLGGVATAYKDLQGAEDAAAKAEDAALDQRLLLLKAIRFQKENASQITQVVGIEAENIALQKQQDRLVQILGLRRELAAGSEVLANQEVQLAKLKGGDVPLAQANALALAISNSLDGIDDNLRIAAAKTQNLATQEANAANSLNLLEKEVLDGLRDANDGELEKARVLAQSAAEAGEKGRAEFNGAIQKLSQDRTAQIQAVEIQAEQTEAELARLGVKLSPLAQQGFDSVFATLQEESQKGLALLPGAISQIQVATGAVTEAATAKAGEVQAALQTERAGTVQSIQALAPSPQDTAAISQAVQGVGKAIAEQGNATITALSNVIAAIGQQTNRIQNMQTQINVLFARTR